MKKQWTKRPLHRILVLLAVCFVTSFVTNGAAAQGENEVTPQVQQLYAQAKQAEQRGDDATAIEQYKAMLKLAPHLAAGYNNLGMLYFNGHDYPHAAETLEHALKLNNNMPSASAMLGMSYFQLGENTKAEPLLRAALKSNPNDNQIEMVLVQILVNLNKLDEATSYLNSYLKRNPRDQRAWYILGKAYLQLSEASLTKIDEIDPNSVVAHEIAGEIDESMHNYDLALVEYKKAISLDPHLPGTHMHMGTAYWFIGKWDSAEDEFKAELANDPYNCKARWKLANSMLEADESSEDALTQLNQAVDRCPGLMQARVDRARALVRMGKQTDALPDLLLAEKDSPTEPTIHFLLGAVYRAQGKTAEALQEMRTYAQLQRDASATIAGQANDASAIRNAAH